MRPRRRRRKRAIPLTGWLKWLPVLAFPFSVLLVETWLNCQMRLNDYEVAELDQRRRQLRQALETLKVEEARLAAISRIGEKAPDLNLLEPNPSQIETIYYEPKGQSPVSSHATLYDVASLASAAKTPGRPEHPPRPGSAPLRRR